MRLSEITFCIKTIHRPWSCHRLVESLCKHIAEPNIIVVDDGQPERRFLPAYPETAAKCQVIHPAQVDVGVGVGRNIAVDAVSTEFMFLLDDDHVVTPNLNLDKLIDRFNKLDIDILGVRQGAGGRPTMLSPLMNGKRTEKGSGAFAMPRPPRADVAGEIYHVLNRGNGRMTIFHKDADYEAFERVLDEGLEKYPVDLISYQWMPNHWHMVLSPRENGTMSKLMYWVTMTHTARHHAHYHSTGNGHLYQGRFKSFPIQNDEHFFVVCRYVERNALAAGLVAAAEDWRFGSLYNWQGGKCGVALSRWPISRLPNWVDRVNQSLSEKEEERLQRAISRSQPFGTPGWVESTARKYNLESTFRKRGRPRKSTQTSK